MTIPEYTAGAIPGREKDATGYYYPTHVRLVAILSRRHRHRCTPEADRGVTSFLMTLVSEPPAGRVGQRWDSNLRPLVPKSNALSTRPPHPPLSVLVQFCLLIINYS